MQRAVELERLEEAAKRRRVNRVRALDRLAAEVAADRIDHRLPGGCPVVRHLLQRPDLVE